MKIRVTKTVTNGNQDGNKPSLAPIEAFSMWGNQAPFAQQEGFYPETTSKDMVVYRSPYNAAFNNVNLGGGQQGHIAFIGHPNEKTFDVVIRDEDNNVVHTVNQNLTPDQLQQYITNSRSTVAQHNNNIIQKANPINLVASK